jgi:hypothetical protein
MLPKYPKTKSPKGAPTPRAHSLTQNKTKQNKTKQKTKNKKKKFVK